MARTFSKATLTPVKLGALALTLVEVVGEPSGLGPSVSAGAIVAGLTTVFRYSLYYIFGKYFSSHYSSPNLFFYMLPIGAVPAAPGRFQA